METSLRLYTVIILSIIFLFLLIFHCDGDSEIKIGFVANLSGNSSALGITARNGAEIAVDEINSNGGINGHPVKIIVEDHGGSLVRAVESDRKLINEGVNIISGHLTSGILMGAYPVFEGRDVLLISPTASTEAFAGFDDNFITIADANSKQGLLLASAALRQGVKRISIVYELSNSSYTEGVYRSFLMEFLIPKKNVVYRKGFVSGLKKDFTDVALDIKRSGSDGILILASGSDSAVICQYLRLKGVHIPVYTGMWAMTPDFLEKGGRSVEGAVIPGVMDSSSRERGYLKFRNLYFERFGKEPVFSSMYSYEVIMILSQAIAESGSTEPGVIKRTLISAGKLKGLQNDLVIDRYGDTVRGYNLFRVEKNYFRKID